MNDEENRQRGLDYTSFGYRKGMGMNVWTLNDGSRFHSPSSPMCIKPRACFDRSSTHGSSWHSTCRFFYPRVNNSSLSPNSDGLVHTASSPSMTSVHLNNPFSHRLIPTSHFASSSKPRILLSWISRKPEASLQVFIWSSYGASGGENEPMDKEDPLRNLRYIVCKAWGSAKSKGGTNMTVPPRKHHNDLLQHT